MRPAEFAPEAIIQAGQELQAAGRNITGFALRQKVGGGNPTRLREVWDAHLEGEAVQNAAPVMELPVEVAEELAIVGKNLTERLTALAVELNTRAVKVAERRVVEAERREASEKAKGEAEVDAATQQYDACKDELDTAMGKVQTLEVKLAEVQATSQAQAVELAQLRERLIVTEQTAKAAEAQHAAELARMNAAIEADRARHQQEANQIRDELAEQKKANQAVTVERDQVLAELATVKAKAEAADQAHQEQCRTAEREAQRAAERIAKAEADQVQATKEASTAREDAAKLRGQVEAMQTQAAELVRALSDRPAQQTEDGQPATKPAKGKKE